MKPLEIDNSIEFRRSRKKIAGAVIAVFAAVILILIVGGFNSAGTVNVLWIRSTVNTSGISYTSNIQENSHTFRTGGKTGFSFSLYNPSGNTVTISTVSSDTAGFTIISDNLPLTILPHSSATVDVEVKLPKTTYAGDLNLTFT
jgi:hypothetical protein